ncbi:hypothetical protein Acr_08g0014730 [Actinidia rufa]|uniref:Uncharacterized protein n=1 Tax=Actinidia rufa TaxID=165716 RepID=A0A7J0F562_9ERIC|nr:hypothetical protein Acr_08g0014730 [Actinidia rufa]
MLILGLIHLSPRLRPHAVEIVPSDDEAPSPTIDVLSSSTAPVATAPASFDPSIVIALATLVAHMDGIHKDLVDHIGQVHERVDRIAKHQELDIKAVQDTLSALSQRHSEFITDVNDFIQSIHHQWVTIRRIVIRTYCSVGLLCKES